MEGFPEQTLQRYPITFALRSCQQPTDCELFSSHFPKNKSHIFSVNQFFITDAIYPHYFTPIQVKPFDKNRHTTVGDSLEDQGIIALFFERSEQAIEETDKKYGGYCYSIAYNILSNREDSEESVSDTYLAAWNTIPPRRPNFLNAFLAKMTRHISIDRWRKLSAKKRGGGEIILALDELD